MSRGENNLKVYITMAVIGSIVASMCNSYIRWEENITGQNIASRIESLSKTANATTPKFNEMNVTEFLTYYG
jgi:hypothetical protein